MIRYLLSRLLSLAVSLAVASVVIFAVVEVIPGDPASYMLGLNAAPETVAALRRELGLEGSVVTRYFAWVGGMLTGDFGMSYTYRVPVAELVAARLWVSLPLTVYALALTVVIAIPGRASGGGEPGAGGGCGGDGDDAAWHRGAELLVRDAAGAGLRDPSAAGSRPGDFRAGRRGSGRG
jgi:ABC-type microcin C transport system permease subunit YejB